MEGKPPGKSVKFHLSFPENRHVKQTKAEIMKGGILKDYTTMF